MPAWPGDGHALTLSRVGHLQLERVLTPSDVDLGLGRASMLEGVGQRLLHHAVGTQAQARRDLYRFALDPDRRVKAGRASLRDEVGKVFKARLRSQHAQLLAVHQHAEQPPHLGQRLAPGTLDRAKRRVRPQRIAVHHGPRPRRLDDHHRDTVGDYVVDLARQAHALAKRRRANVQFARGVQLLGKLPGCSLPAGCSATGPSDNPRQHNESNATEHRRRQARLGQGHDGGESKPKPEPKPRAQTP
jgi:hypothetical protein